MDKIKVYVAAPISGFQDDRIYYDYRKQILKMIEHISDICLISSEIQGITSSCEYDSPESSVEKDFQAIDASDVLLLLHPTRIQSSSLIELGFACAKNKKIIIVGDKYDLPYIARGLEKSSYKAITLSTSHLSDIVIEQIKEAIIMCSMRNNE